MNPYQNPNQNNLLFRSTVDRRNTEVKLKNKTRPNQNSKITKPKNHNRPEMIGTENFRLKKKSETL